MVEAVVDPEDEASNDDPSVVQGVTDGRAARAERRRAERRRAILEAAIPSLPDAPPTALVEVALSPDGSTIYYLADDGELRAWDVASGVAVVTPVTAPTDTRAIAIG